MSYDLLKSIERTARRKAHKCIWCGEAINIGDRYVYQAGVFEGDFQCDEWHPECNRASQDYFRESHEEEFDPYSNERPYATPTPTDK